MPLAGALRTWIRTRGRGAWIDYLATHPGRTLSVRHDVAEIFDPPRDTVAPYWGGAAHGLFVHGPWLLVLALVSFLVATLPVAVMVWDADALELYRHAIVLCVVTQLVCLTFALLTAEALAERAGERYRPLLKAATSIPK